MAAAEYLSEHRNATSDEICEFLELQADAIIEDTIEQLNSDADDASPWTPDDEGLLPGGG
jgi:hypothetical protein